MPSCKLTKKTLSNILLHAFCVHFLRIHHIYLFRRGFESLRAQFLSGKRKVVLLVIYLFIQVNVLHVELWHLTFSCGFSLVQFLSNKLELFVSCNNSVCKRKKQYQINLGKTCYMTNPFRHSKI